LATNEEDITAETLKKLEKMFKEDGIKLKIDYTGGKPKLTKDDQYINTRSKAIGDSLGSVAGSAYNLTKGLSSSSVRLSDVTSELTSIGKEIPGVGALVQGVGSVAQEGLRIAEAGVDTWRSLSDVGAGFNNSIMDMSNMAAKSRLSLDEFAGIVSQNSEALTAMGGSVTKGAKKFSEQSAKMFEGKLGSQLLTMGYSFEEVNDMLLQNMSINRRRYAMDKTAAENAYQSAFALAKEQDKMAKLTGVSRKELQKEIDDKLRQGNVQARTRLEEMRGNTAAAEKLKQALINIKPGGDAAKLVLEELYTKGNIASKEAVAAAQALGPGVMKEIQAQVAMIKDKNSGLPALQQSAIDVGMAIDKRARSEEFLATAALGAHNEYTQARAQLVQDTQYFTDALTSASDGAQTDAERRIAYAKAIADIDNKQTNAGDQLTHATVQGELALRNLGNIINDSLIGPNGAIRHLATELESFAQGIENFNKKENLDEVDRQLKETIETAQQWAPGSLSKAAIQPVKKRETKKVELSDQDYNDIATSLGMIKELTDETGNVEAGQVLAKGFTDSVKKEFLDLIKQQMPGEESVPEKVAALIESGNTQAIEELYKRAQRQGSERNEEQISAFVKQAKMTSVDENIANAVKSLKEDTSIGKEVKRQTGSLGAVGSLIEDFGKGTKATLHGKEGVITSAQLENMAKGVSSTMQSMQPAQFESLNKSVFSAMQNVKPPTKPETLNTASLEQAITSLSSKINQISTNNNQSSGNEMAEALNSSLKELTSLSAKHISVAEKQLRTQKGMGGNVFKGL